MEFLWNCTDHVGADCESSSRSVLDMSSFTSGALLTIPTDTLPIGKWKSMEAYDGNTKHDDKQLGLSFLFRAARHDALANQRLHHIPTGFLPKKGVKYTFGVRVSMGAQGAQLRFDETACTVSTFGTALPHVSISPKVGSFSPPINLVAIG